jgi:phage tail-like protein
LRLPETAAFQPFDLAAAENGGIFVLDSVNRAYWAFDEDFRALAVLPGTPPPPTPFWPADGGAPSSPPPPPMPASFPLALSSPFAIATVGDGSVLILDNAPGAGASTLYRYRNGTQLGPGVKLRGEAQIANETLAGASKRMLSVTAHDIAYDSATATLFAADRYGRQSLAFSVTLDPALSLDLARTYLPMHFFGGRGLVSWTDDGATVISYDVAPLPADDTKIRWARLQPVDQADYARQAVLETPVFDGKTPDCLWDTLFLDACIPPATSVDIAITSGNDATLVADPNAPFIPQPPLYLRDSGAEIPFYNPFAGRPRQPDRLGTWEVLLQQVSGRYLKLRLTLSGTGRATPQLKSLRVYYPRFSYARRYLPATYMEDPTSASFTERLLANPKGFYADIEAKIVNVGCLFDPDSVPRDALDWLASWLGLTLDPLWQDIGARLQTGTTQTTPTAPDRRRLFIRFATRLFARRGTVDGIVFALQLLLDPGLEATLRRFSQAALTPDPALFTELTRLGLPLPTPADTADDIEDLFTQFLLSADRPSKIRLVELFMTRNGLAAAAGDPAAAGATATAHRFAVMIPEGLPAAVQTMVSRIVDLEKPAHTQYEVQLYWDYFRVGDARLGLDTILGEDSRFLPVMFGQTALSQGYLSYPPPMNARDRMVLNRDPLRHAGLVNEGLHADL